MGWWRNICAAGQTTKMDICQSIVDKYCVTQFLFSKHKQFRKRSIWCRSYAALKSSSGAVLFVVKYLAILFLTRERRKSGSMSLSSAHVLKPVFGGRALGSENWGKKEGNCRRKVDKYSCIQIFHKYLLWERKRHNYAPDLATGQMFSRLISLLRLFALFTVDESALRDLLCARFDLTTEAAVVLTCIVMKCFGFI